MDTVARRALDKAREWGMVSVRNPSPGVEFKVSKRPTRGEVETLLRTAFFLGREEARGNLTVIVNRHRKIIGVRE